METGRYEGSRPQFIIPMKQQLVQALEMSLMPNDQAIHEARAILEAAKTHPGFLREIVLILADPGMRLEIRTGAACAVKELILQHYEPKEGAFVLFEEDKQAFRDSVFHIFAEVHSSRVLRKTMEETYKKVVSTDFPQRWPDLTARIAETIKNCPDKSSLQSPLLILALVLERYQAEMDEKRRPLEFIVENVFPFLENVATCQINWDNFDASNKAISLLLLRCFQAAIFLKYDEYFTLDRFKLWMYFVKRCLDQKLDSDQTQRPTSWQKVLETESSLDWKIKRTSSNIICRTLHLIKIVKKKIIPYMSDLRDQFFNHYATGFLTSCFNFLKLGLDTFVSPKFAQNCFKYIFYAFQVEAVVQGLSSELDGILFDLCTPMLSMNQKDEENWNVEPASFLYAQDCRLDGHNLVKYASKDLIDQILRLVDNNHVPMISKVLEFTKACFETQTNVRTGTPLTPRFKECLIALVIHCHKKIVNESESIQAEADRLVEGYLTKEIFSEHDIIKARVCNLLTVYGAVSVQAPESVTTLCRGLEAALGSSHLAVQTSALLALNKATANDLVCRHFSGQLPAVFELVFNCMRKVDYKELVYAAEGLIKDFGDNVVPFGAELLKHFSASFYQYLQHAKVDLDETDDEDADLDDDSELEANVVYESIYAAEACLEAVLSVLQVTLPDNVRLEANNLVLVMVCDVILETNNELFLKALAVLNFILFKSSSLDDPMKFFFPVICYVLNAKPNAQLLQIASGLPENFLKVITEIDLPSLSEGVVCSSLGCILNYISKMGPDFYTATDYFGVKFIDLLFETIVKVIKDSLSTNSDTDIIFMLRIIIGLLEHSKDRFEMARFTDFLEMVLALSVQNRTENLNQHILQCVSMFVWHSPAVAVGQLRDGGRLEAFYSALFAQLPALAGESAKERVLYGLVALLELPDDMARAMNLSLVMGALVRTAEDLTSLRQEAESPPREQPCADVDVAKAYEDDESDDDDFDAADDELEAAEGDEQFRYEAPLEAHCPLAYLKFVLQAAEASRPALFGDITAAMGEAQLASLRRAVLLGEEYMLKVRAEAAGLANN